MKGKWKAFGLSELRVLILSRELTLSKELRVLILSKEFSLVVLEILASYRTLSECLRK